MKTVSKCYADRELPIASQIDFADNRHIAVLGFVELPVQAKVLVKVLPPIAVPDVTARSLVEPDINAHGKKLVGLPCDQNVLASRLESASRISITADLQVRRKQRINSQLLQECGISFHLCMDKDTGLVRIGNDLFQQPIPAFAVRRGHTITQRIGLDAFDFVVQVAPFFVEEGFAVSNQELHVPRLRMIDCGEVDFVENSV